MKFLALFLLVLTTNSFASGCFPDDVQLQGEKVLTVFSDSFKASINCDKNNICSIYAYNDKPGMWREFYQLVSANSQETSSNQQIEKIELKVYQQFFSSSCTDLYRVVVGFDLNGKRFRSEQDLLEL